MQERHARRSFLRLAGGTLGLLATPVIARAGATSLVSASPAAATPPAGEPLIDHPTGSEDLVLRVEYVGGFLPPQARLSELPIFSLFGDGRVVTLGPQIAIWPSPALPNLRQAYLLEDGIQEVLTAARDAGLMEGPRRYHNNLIADAPWTVFTVNAEERTTWVAAYALGLGEDPSWTDEARAAIAELQRFVEQLGDLSAWIAPSKFKSDDEPFPIERLQIVVEPIDPTQPVDPNDPTRDQPPVDWPLERSLSAFASMPDEWGLPEPLRCGVVQGEEAAKVVALAEQTNILTPWVSEGVSYLVSFRPLLPDERGCPPRPPFEFDVEATPSA